MSGKSKFEKDFEEAVQFFPKLSFRKNEKKKFWIVSGELDICDQKGDFWETFRIAIFLPFSYPFCVPLVKELSTKVQREIDWHINKDGFCCVDIDHKLLQFEKAGVNLTKFIKCQVYPYFANTIFKRIDGEYAAGEYKHGFEGILQFYEEEL